MEQLHRKKKYIEQNAFFYKSHLMMQKNVNGQKHIKHLRMKYII